MESRRLNSAQVMAVATATFRLSEVERPAGKLGMNRRRLISEAVSGLIPLPSFPMTISPFELNSEV